MPVLFGWNNLAIFGYGSLLTDAGKFTRCGCHKKGISKSAVEDLEISVRITRDPKLAQDWELVLIAQGLSPRVRRTEDGFLLCVPQEQAEKALAGLSAYERENAARDRESESIGSAGMGAGLFVAALLLVFHFVIVFTSPTLSWFERGGADAERIMDGEFWRAVTALTLHADTVHAISNAFGAALFLGAAAGTLGPGLACALVLLAGAGGNFANAVLHGSSHISVGASTAIFGAVGILGGSAMARQRSAQVGRRRAWVPIGAALALLAMLGTEGENVDLMAHLFGFLLGAVLGILIAFAKPAAWSRSAQRVCGSAALAVIVYCWAVALR